MTNFFPPAGTDQVFASRRTGAMTRTALIIAIGVLLVSMAGMYIVFASFVVVILHLQIWIGALIGALLFGAILGTVSWRYIRLQRSVSAGGARAISALLNAAARERLRPVRKMAAQELVQLLPTMDRSTADGLSSADRTLLHNLLQSPNHDLVVAALKGIGNTGDREAAEAVTRLTHSKSSTVREAAKACLPALEQRISGTVADDSK